MKCLRDFFEDHFVTVVMAIIVIGYIGFCIYCVCTSGDAGESVVLRDGGQSYACTVSRVYKTPHDCKPIKTAVSGYIVGLVR